MNLRLKLLLGIGLALIFVFTLVAVFSSITMEESYLRLEQRNAVEATESTANTLVSDIANLYSVCRDYSAWTDTYLFTEGGNPGWIAQNTADDFFDRFGINYLLVFNRSNELVYSKGFNISSGETEDVPEDLVADIRKLNREGEISGSINGSAGILGSTAGPVIVASHPILHDDFTGPPGGSLHVIRAADARYFSDIAVRTGHSMTLIPAGEARGNVSLSGVLSLVTPGTPVVVVPEGDDTVAGYTAIAGLRDTGGFYLKVTDARTIYHTGQDTILIFLVSLFWAGLFLILFVLLFIDRIVLSRLNSLIWTVREKRETGGNHRRPGGMGDDELARLALEIDPVFARLAESRVRLRESEERYRTLAESARDFIFIIDREDRIVYVNSYAARSVGRTREDLIGKSRADLFPKDAGERQRANILRVFANGEPIKVESSLPLQSGERWHDTLLVPLRDHDGTITGVMGISRDITERIEAEKALRESGERFKTVMDSLDAFVYVADMKTYEILFVNQTGRKIWGDVVAKTCWQTFHKGLDGPCPFCTNDRLLDGNGDPAETVVWEFRNTANRRWYECRDRAIQWTDGRIVRLEISTDITERKRMEEALIRANNKLNLLSGITRHDILNQLTALKAYIDLSAEHASGDDVIMEFIRKEMAVAEVIDRQITFTRDYHKLGVMAPVWQNVAEIINWTTQSLIAGSVEIRTDFSDLEVFADPLLEKVFFNLMDNALRYGGEKMTTIRFSSMESEDGLTIVCEDNGTGIADENKDLVFTRGYAHNTGLGLFLSREILSITEITITETGIYGKGARFEIHVPKGSYRFTGTSAGG